MNWIPHYIAQIRALIDEGTDASLTYAALEARLAIERVCYERLKISHSYISNDDLRTWKPQYVVQTLMEMVDPQIANEWTLSMGSEPGDNPESYIQVGTQKGFNPKKLNQLWQAMSSFLHNTMPKHRDDSISHYSSQEKIRPKLDEVLTELDRLAEGTIIGAMVFKQVSFECSCGQLNKRAEHGLAEGEAINCINENCKEQFIVEKIDGQYFFNPHVAQIACFKCASEARFPFRALAETPKGRLMHFICTECQAQNYFKWKLMHLARTSDMEPTAPPDLPSPNVA